MSDDVTGDLARLLAEAPRSPRRVVCLTEETTETLYRLDAGDLVVGVSGYTVFPPEARAKPKVSAFTTARIDEILSLRPDLVLGFSDLQAHIARELIQRGVAVLIFNQRSIAEILQMVRVLGGIVDRTQQAHAIVDELTPGLEQVAAAAAVLSRRPRVFLEEWNDPLITGIRWWPELVEIAGGTDICADRRDARSARQRVVEPEHIAELNPDAVIASWCGKKVSRRQIVERPGWSRVAAVKEDQLYEIKSAYVLQPGPIALSAGLRQVARIIEAVSKRERLPKMRSDDLRRADGEQSNR